MVVVAQLVRAADCGSAGRGFEPPLSPLVNFNAFPGWNAFFAYLCQDPPKHRFLPDLERHLWWKPSQVSVSICGYSKNQPQLKLTRYRGHFRFAGCLASRRCEYTEPHHRKARAPLELKRSIATATRRHARDHRAQVSARPFVVTGRRRNGSVPGQRCRIATPRVSQTKRIDGSLKKGGWSIVPL